MSLSPVFAFAIGSTAAFAGTLPLGPINLSVVETTINRSFRSALWLSAAAAMVEICQSFIALHSSAWLTHALASNPFVKVCSFLLFVLLGLNFLLRKKPETCTEKIKQNKGNHFLRGLLIAGINPQAIPFWVFVLTYLETARRVKLNTGQHYDILFSFLAGVSVGKLAALVLFALLSRMISSRAGHLSHLVNKIIGCILLGIGLFQGFQALWT